MFNTMTAAHGLQCGLLLPIYLHTTHPAAYAMYCMLTMITPSGLSRQVGADKSSAQYIHAVQPAPMYELKT